MRIQAFVAVSAVSAIVGCGDGGSAPETVTQTVSVSASPTGSSPTQSLQTPTHAAPPPSATTPVATTPAIMPAVVCMNLQAAQDLIQEHGVFYSRSEDASGQGRMQVNDRNWIVVAQDPAPGTPITEGDAVLSVVKFDEPNPC